MTGTTMQALSTVTTAGVMVALLCTSIEIALRRQHGMPLRSLRPLPWLALAAMDFVAVYLLQLSTAWVPQGFLVLSMLFGGLIGINIVWVLAWRRGRRKAPENAAVLDSFEVGEGDRDDLR
ncbi:hypothetical protein [Saccharopolyspora elongata]|uniref:Uncharacterized protein n=1 Tax=Saccharopolyspora elongata TaxID=2530387 RepID=A0A4V6PDX0_9PSEU|nr:hypothetical protein [Saccharopolyspora elongata]TDD49007.1 hypothetical protein E1288_21040 [Saccharopolyspora elongata]